jgi:hypothetical protein
LKVGLVLGWPCPHPHVGEHAADRLEDAEVAQGVEGLERVVVVLAAVVDAAHPRPEQEVLVGQDLVPERLDLADLGEEPVATDVEPPPVSLDGAADAADHAVGLEHRRPNADLPQLVGRGQARRTRADDDDGTGIAGPGGVRGIVGHRRVRTSSIARWPATDDSTAALFPEPESLVSAP